MNLDNNHSETLQKKEFMTIAKKIENIKLNVEKPLGGILNYTSLNNINKSFFDENIEKVTQRDIDNATLFLNSYLQQFKRLRKEVQESAFLNEVQKKLFLSTLQSYCLKIMLFKSAVYIEGEKGGYELNIKDKAQHLRNIERIETIVYGPKISEQPKEVDTVMTHLDSLYQTNKDKLTHADQHQFTMFLQKFPHIPSETKKLDDSPKKKLGRLRQEDFARLMQKGLALYTITSNIVKITEKVSELKEENGILYIPAISTTTGEAQTKEELEAIYTQFGYTPDVLKIKIQKCAAIEVDIPSKEINIPSATNYYDVIRSLELLSHEEITHVITGTNKKNAFNIESDTYLELQEGVAMLNEKAVTTDIKNISAEPTIHHISTFIGDNYNSGDTYNLLRIYYILTGKKNAESLAKTRTERVKRFHAYDQGGANRKDVVYWRGMLDVLAYIQDLDANKLEDIQGLQKNIFNFYIGKLGKEEVKNAQELTEGFNITPKNIILPADIGKILLGLLERNSPDGKGIKITNGSLGANDIRFKASLPEHNLNYTQKKLLLEMRSFIEQRRE